MNSVKYLSEYSICGFDKNAEKTISLRIIRLFNDCRIGKGLMYARENIDERVYHADRIL